MADDPLRELLNSPLEESKKTRRGAPTTSVTVSGIESAGVSLGRPATSPMLWATSLMVGAVAVLLGYWIGGDTAAVVTETVATTTTTTIAPQGSVFPETYVPVDDHLAMRVERILIQPNSIFVTMSSVVANTLAPGANPGLSSGRWELVLSDGRRIASTEQGADHDSFGFLSVHFSVEGVIEEEIVGFELTGVGQSLTASFGTSSSALVELADDGSPAEITLHESTFALDSGVDLQIERMTLSPSIGRIDWSLTGSDPDAVATVFPVMHLLVGDASVGATTRVDTAMFRFFQRFSELNPPTRSGFALFDPVDDGGFPGTADSLDLQLEVRWTVFSPTRVVFPLDGAYVSSVDG